VFVDKSLRLDDWSQYPTPVPMIVYACLDAKLSRVLAGVMFKKAESQNILNSVGSAPQDLQVGSGVEFVLYNKVVTRGVSIRLEVVLKMLPSGVRY
jgi:hypothetical protein